MFAKIIKKQIELNESITHEWRAKDWELAIITECAEAIDSTAWKWWKAGIDDIDNLKVEAIDLLHFVISYGLSCLYTSDNMAFAVNDIDETMSEEWEVAQDDINVNCCRSKTDLIKQLLSSLLAYNESPSSRFSKLVYWLFVLFLRLGMDSHEVRAMYMAKNLLNEYRQLRGYKDPNGNYCKVINGQEDNIHFLNIVKEIGVNSPYLKILAFAKMDEVVKNA
jgi:dimeric dUTPase (all-alpha-NTP-PPase superfamily)